MTRPVRRSDLALVAVDLRHTGELLLHPCHCGQRNCTLGEHLWRSVRDMAPGPRAASTDPDGKGWRYEEERDGNGNVLEVWPIPSGDTVGESATHEDPTWLLFREYQSLLTDARDSIRDLHDFVQRLRPDRTVPNPDKPSDEVWCRPCLNLGLCEPRYRGDECRWHYDFRSAYHMEAPAALTQARHEGRRITEKMAVEAIRAERQAKKRNGRKKRAS